MQNIDNLKRFAMKIDSYYDVNPDFLIQPYQKGVRLVRPTAKSNGAELSISKLNGLSVQASFTNLENKFIAVNERVIEVLGVTSVNDCAGNTPGTFLGKEFAPKVMKNYQEVIHTKTLKIIEECGSRIDDFPLQAISFRYPWFYEKKVVGAFNISILINQPAIQNFAVSMTEVLATGLLGETIEVPKLQADSVYFTSRENEILRFLLKGFTAKNIANSLVISKRTVEHHIENMKHKACCNSTIELINKYYNKLIDDSKGHL